jgi:serpin B
MPCGGQEDYQFQSEFLDLLAANYGAETRRLDFVRQKKACAAINDWVSRQTEGRITELVPPDALDASIRLVLTHAVYFDAAWARRFDPRRTQRGIFHLLMYKKGSASGRRHKWISVPSA